KNAAGVADSGVTAAALGTVAPPTSGQVLTYNGVGLAWGNGASAGGWSLTGNGGTIPSTQFLGTTDNTPLELRVNNARVLRLEPSAESPNVLLGSPANSVAPGLVGVTIGGGGTSVGNQPNMAIGEGRYGTIGGGYSNVVAHSTGTIGGGGFNTVTREYAAISGGQYNSAP